MRSLVLAAFIATFTTVSAQADIGWKTQEIAPGSSLTLSNDRGQVFTHVRQPSTGWTVRFDTFAGKSAKGAYVGSYLTNDRGEIVRTISADGAVTDYEPHRCNRSLGKCSYIIKTPEGTKVMRTRITELTGNGIKYSEFGREGLVESGFTALDGMGSSAGGWSVDHATGQRVETRQVSAVYK